MFLRHIKVGKIAFFVSKKRDCFKLVDKTAVQNLSPHILSNSECKKWIFIKSHAQILNAVYSWGMDQLEEEYDKEFTQIISW